MILVTGATGTTGLALVKALSERKIATRALARNLDKVVELPYVEWVKGDLLEVDSLQAAVAGVDAIYLLSSGGPESVPAQKNLIDVAKAAGVKRIVKHSGMGASRQSPIHLAQWHAEIEEYLVASGLEYTILRPHFFLQNLLWDAASIKGQAAIYAPMADARFSAIDARDIAAAAVTVLTEPGHHGKTYDLTGSEAVSYSDIAAAISQAAGKPIQYVTLDFDAYYQGGLKAGLPEWMASDMTELFRYFASGAAADISPAVEQLTGKPARGLQTFVNDYSAALV